MVGSSPKASFTVEKKVVRSGRLDVVRFCDCDRLTLCSTADC